MLPLPRRRLNGVQEHKGPASGAGSHRIGKRVGHGGHTHTSDSPPPPSGLMGLLGSALGFLLRLLLWSFVAVLAVVVLSGVVLTPPAGKGYGLRAKLRAFLRRKLVSQYLKSRRGAAAHFL